MLFVGLAWAERDSCMAVPAFSDWTKTIPHPYHPASDRAKAIKRGHKALKLGMTLEQVHSLMPQPDWSEDELRKGCTWYYATKLASDGESFKSLTVRFGGDVVNGVGTAGLSFSEHSRSKHSRPKI
jgi:hypothetical protein